MKLSTLRTTLSGMLALAMALLIAAPAFAAPPAGSGPDNPIPLVGTMTGTLGPGQVAWYSYRHDPNFNDAVTLKTNPPMPVSFDDAGNAMGAFFNVEWQGLASDSSFPGGLFSADVPGFYRVGQSTQSGLNRGGALPDGTQYWQQNQSSNGLDLILQVVNATGASMTYALTEARSTQAVSPDDYALPAPAAPPIAAQPKKTTAVAGAAASVPSLDGSSPDTALPFAGTAIGKLGPGQSVWYSFTHDPNLNEALTLKSNPGLPASSEGTGYTVGAFFNVNWFGSSADPSFPGGSYGLDAPGYYRVAQSTQSGLSDGGALPDGVQYWQQDKSPTGTSFVVQVVNSTSSAITYALTLDRKSVV